LIASYFFIISFKSWIVHIGYLKLIYFCMDEDGSF